MAIRRQSFILGMLLAPVTIFLGIFFLAPLLIIALFSLLSPGLYGGVEWSFYHWNYGRIFGWADGIEEIFEPIYLEILLRSLAFGALTVVLCLVICYPVAFWVARLPERARLFFLFLVALPFFSSLIVRLYAWLLILKPSGVLNEMLRRWASSASRWSFSTHPLRWFWGWSM
jgi:spermidine/putrescine transport system permease protein